MVVKVKTLCAYPSEGVLSILLVLNSCGLEGFYFLDDAEGFEYVGDII